MTGGEKSNGSEGDKTAPERFGASYLAMDAAQKKGSSVPAAKRGRKSGRGKRVFFFVLAAGGIFYFQREKLLPLLAENTLTGPAYKALVGRFFPASDDPAGLPLTPLPAGTGGTTTFASGQGFGAVSPDDGSASFRVVVPPTTEANP